MNTPIVIADAVIEPLTIDECRSHLEAQRYGDATIDEIDDVMIAGWLAAAREYCEDFLGLTLAIKTLEIALDSFPTKASPGYRYIELPMGPVRRIAFIGDDLDVDAQLDPLTYVLDSYRVPNRVYSVSATLPWPFVTASTNAIKVRYVAGYGVDVSGDYPLPKVLRAAILLVLGHLYAHREDSTEDALTTVPIGAEALMRPRRVRLGMA